MKQMWTVEEKTILDIVFEKLINSGLNDIHRQLSESLSALEYQAIALSLYPSVLNSNVLGGTERNLETLVIALSNRYREEDVFVLPTKAILSRSYEIGKINLFYMLNHIAKTVKNDVDLFDNKDPLSFVSDRMLSIMTEDVLLDLLGDSVLKDAKPVAAMALAERVEVSKKTGRSTLVNSEYSIGKNNLDMRNMDAVQPFLTY